MDNINDSIARAMESGRPKMEEQHPLDARTCMATKLITFSPDQTVRQVMDTLLKHKISGAPVVDANMKLVGMISELDCIRAVASGSYDHAPYQMARTVEELMTREVIVVEPTEEIFTLVELFEKHSIRRIPVVDEGVLVGQVSRRDILREFSLRY